MSDSVQLQHYLEHEKGSPKHEFVQGQLQVLPDPDDAYFAVRMNLAFLLNEHFSKSDCKLHVADTRVYIESVNACLCPDILLSCDHDGETHALYKTQPNFIVEIINSHNGSYKRGEKFAYYRKLASLQAVLLVDAERVQIDYFQRQAEHWEYHSFEAGMHLEIPALHFHCDVEEVYQDVFDE